MDTLLRSRGELQTLTFNPESDLRLFLLQYSRYQQVDGFSPDCATEFGGSLADCIRVQRRIKTIFNPDLGIALSKSDVGHICHNLGIRVLVVSPHDPIWTNPKSWIWKATPIVDNDFVRMYRCDAGSLTK